MAKVRYFGLPAQGAVRIADFANIVDGETIVIGSKTYEWDDDNDVVAGHVKVTIGASDAACITNLIDAINDNPPTPAVLAFVDPIDAKTCRIEATKKAAAGNMALTEDTLDADAVVVSGATLVHGENGAAQKPSRGTYTVVAIDVSAGSIVIATGLDSPQHFQCECRDANGVLKAITSKVTVDTDGHILIDFDGATNPAATDKIFWQAWE